MGVPAIETLDELADGARLVAGKLEIGHEAETVVHRRHGNLPSYQGCTVAARGLEARRSGLEAGG
jgi:hypothetical protein